MSFCKEKSSLATSDLICDTVATVAAAAPEDDLKEKVLALKDAKEPGVFLPDDNGNEGLPAGAKEPLALDPGLLGTRGGRGGG